MNKPITQAILVLTALLVLSSAAFSADLTGTWQVTITGTAPDGTTQKDTGVAILKQAGDSITGSLGPDQTRQNPLTEGTIKNDKVILKASPRPDRIMTFELTVNGEKLVGTVTRTGDARQGTVEFVKSPSK